MDEHTNDHAPDDHAPDNHANDELRGDEDRGTAERGAWQAELEHLKQEHRDLDAAIDALMQVGSADRLQVQRLKKRKLVLRDRMTFLSDQLTPDIIA